MMNLLKLSMTSIMLCSSCLADPTAVTVESPIIYDWGYTQSSNDFVGLNVDFTAETTGYVVLVNFHASAPLNLRASFHPEKRTLQWATTFDFAFFHPLDTWKSVHEALALPRHWSNDDYRKNATFMIIPPKTMMRFKIGYSKPQQSDENPDFGKDKHLPSTVEKYKKEEKTQGHGLQIRLHDIPKNVFLVTIPLKRHFNVESLFEGAKDPIKAHFGEETKKIMANLKTHLTYKLSKVQIVQAFEGSTPIEAHDSAMDLLTSYGKSR